MKLRTKDPWISAPEYSKNLNGLIINLLVRNIETASYFLKNVIKAKIIYEDIDFCAVEGFGSNWCLHAAHSYDMHPFYNLIKTNEQRGVGVELRLIGCNPDQAELNAKKFKYKVVSKSQNKAHGLIKCYIEDNDGYCWVPSMKI